MNTTLYPLCALFAWIVTLTSARHLPAMRKQPTRLATWTLYVFFALIFTTGWAVVWHRIDGWTGLPEANTLVAMCLVVCYSASALVLLQLWSYPPDRARRLAAFTVTAAVLVLAAMLTLFLRSDAVHHHQSSFTQWYGGSAQYTAYLLVYLTAYTGVEIEIIRLCRRYGRLTTRSWLRTGLITTSVGAAIGLLYSLTRLADLAAAHLGVDIGAGENIAEVGAGLGALLVMIGLTLHSWGPRISTTLLRARRLIAYARLRPLWATFYALDPSIAFDDQRRTDTRPVVDRARAARRVLKDPEFHVARRVVEILDGILALRPYQDPAFAQQARAHYTDCGLSGVDLDAAVTAAQIRAALHAPGRSPRRAQPPAFTAEDTPADLDAELAWLLKVTHHFTRQPDTIAPSANPSPTPTGGTP